MPLPWAIVAIQLDAISTMIAISISGRSRINHVQASIPVAMADGVNASKGADTT
jgi:hypothetical protein